MLRKNILIHTYNRGGATENIVKVLSTLDLGAKLLQKKFVFVKCVK